MSPRTSITLPTGPRVGVGHVVISTTTISPGSAAADWPVGICTSVRMRRSNGCTNPRPESARSKRPTIVELPRSRMRMMRPSSAVFARSALDAREHTIAVHRFLDVAADTYTSGAVVAGLVGHDKAKTGRVRLQPADDEIHLVGQTRRGRPWSRRARRSSRAPSAGAGTSRALRCGILRILNSSRDVAGCVTFSRINLTICSLVSIDV